MEKNPKEKKHFYIHAGHFTKFVLIYPPAPHQNKTRWKGRRKVLNTFRERSRARGGEKEVRERRAGSESVPTTFCSERLCQESRPSAVRSWNVGAVEDGGLPPAMSGDKVPGPPHGHPSRHQAQRCIKVSSDEAQTRDLALHLASPGYRLRWRL